ncbi:uncharacterized protein LOC133472558 isoform X4 [Phyllopteryx taeniolatus]|uniref:uncharacterized protein LOC133472558 isoform X4 n=1 Tax=Phyllopteryx taeniolatus TaxID=161469 RepID=UPI002AD3651D|nr:uncharacterized protein LOC133472558 isoform X4 [Phyllopteryx taeniolatus]
MCARTAVKYEKELSGTKEEDEPHRQLVDAARMQPRVVLHRADVSENLHAERKQSVSPHIKEEEVQRIKEEEEEFLHMKEEEREEIIKVPLNGVHLKSEDEGQREESRGAEPSSRNSASDGDHCGGSQAEGLLAPLSNSDDMTLHSTHTDENDTDEPSEGGECSQTEKDIEVE